MDTQAKFKARADIIKSMAHPARLLIVDELSKGPRCVKDLRDKVGSDISTVSKHLSILKKAGIIDSQKRGAQVYYSLRCVCVLNFFQCVETVLKTNADQRRKMM